MKNQITFPDLFVERLKSILPEAEHAAFFESMQTPLRKAIRVNTLKISVEAFQKMATEMSWQLTPVPWCPTGFWIDRESHAVPLGKHWMHAAGLFYIQEAASMLPPEMLLSAGAEETEVESGSRNLKIIDMAAAPGSKTTQLAALTGNTGVIIANEPIIKRIKSLSHNLEQQGVATAVLTRKDGSAFAKYLPNTLDRILLDAPCTGEGTARKDKRALLKFSEDKIAEMAQLQYRLAVAAFHCLRPDGEMVYSTCTLGPEENESIVSRLLIEFGDKIELVPLEGANGLTEFRDEKYDPRVAGTRRLWPHREDCEGFFAAKLRKLASTETGIMPSQPRRGRSPFSRVPDKREMELLAQLKKWFGCTVELPRSYSLSQRDNEVWLRANLIEGWARELDFERTGNRILKLNREGKLLRVTHLGASLLLKDATKHVLELTDEQRDEYLSGRDFKIPPNPPLKKGGGESGEAGERGDLAEGQCVIRHRGFVLGLGLLRDGKVKNQLPREFIVL